MNPVAVSPARPAAARSTAAPPGPVRAAKDVRITLYLPIAAVLALVGPIVVVLSPWPKGLGFRARLQAAGIVAGALFALSGTDIAIDAPGARLRVKVL